MARIYIGRTTGIGAFERHIVLKLILPERADDNVAVSMFLDEARLAAMLNHQNVAQVFEVGEEAGIHYLAMEYVHGQDLRAFLAKAGGSGIRVPLELGLTIVSGAAAGLNHAHERRAPDGTPLGIVHRDVSPSNIMVGYDGAVKMLDFGIAKAAQRSVETVSGIIKGKFAYMSPEQCRGREVDRRSDVFSLGIILYEVTTQHRCFRADSDFDTMHRIVTGDVTKPTRLVQNYPPGLEAIVLKALSVDPTQRYQSAGLLLEAIESFSLQNRTPLSTMSLGRFMREMFGEVLEPWLVAGMPGTVDNLGPRASEGTISNTNDKDADARYPSPTEPPPFARSQAPSQPPPPNATLRMSDGEIEDALRTGGRRTPAPGVPLAARTLVDVPSDHADDPDGWSRAKSYPVGAMPAVASAQTMPPESAMATRPTRPPPTTIQGMGAAPPMGPPHGAMPVGSSPGMQPPVGQFPHGTMPIPSGKAVGSMPEDLAHAPTQIQPMMNPHGELAGPMGAPMSPPPMQQPPGGTAGFTAGAPTGSGLSHSQVTPYPSVADLEGYEGEGSLKPGRRGLYIGVALATIGLVIAIAIGRSGQGPTSTNAGGGPSGPTLPDDKTAGTTPDTTTQTPAPVVQTPAPAPTPTPAPPPTPTPPPTHAAPPPTPTHAAPTPPPPPVPTHAATTTPATTPTPATTTTTTTAPTTTPPTPVPTTTQPPEPPKPTTIKVVIKSEPTGAEVLEAGKKVGTTPFSTTLPIDTASTPYTLRHDGYADEVVTIKHAKDYDAITHLAKKPEPTKTSTKTGTSGTKSNKSSGGTKSNTGSSSGTKSNTGGTSSGTKTTAPKEPCQKRGGPIQPFGPKLPLCPE